MWSLNIISWPRICFWNHDTGGSPYCNNQPHLLWSAQLPGPNKSQKIKANSMMMSLIYPIETVIEAPLWTSLNSLEIFSYWVCCGNYLDLFCRGTIFNRRKVIYCVLHSYGSKRSTLSSIWYSTIWQATRQPYLQLWGCKDMHWFRPLWQCFIRGSCPNECSLPWLRHSVVPCLKNTKSHLPQTLPKGDLQTPVVLSMFQTYSTAPINSQR